MSIELITINIPTPKHSPDLGEVVLEQDWNTYDLVSLTVTTLNSVYQWFYDGSVPVLRRNGEPDALIRHCTLPVWVVAGSTRALLVEKQGVSATFVRTSRVIHAEWRIRQGTRLLTRRLTLA